MALSFSHAILVWARSKPADGRYNYSSHTNCVVCQFLKETGRAKKPYVYGNEWSEGKHGKPHRFDFRVDFAACLAGLGEPHRTYGAFADCLEAELVK